MEGVILRQRGNVLLKWRRKRRRRRRHRRKKTRIFLSVLCLLSLKACVVATTQETNVIFHFIIK
jgi:Tfp pilus assembly protein PilN